MHACQSGVFVCVNYVFVCICVCVFDIGRGDFLCLSGPCAVLGWAMDGRKYIDMYVSVYVSIGWMG